MQTLSSIRAWDAENKRMISPDMLFINKESDGGTCSLFATLNNLSANYELMLLSDISDVDKKPIYQSDIIQFEDDFGDIYTCEVMFFHGAFQCYYGEDGLETLYILSEMHSIKNIGNKYENPELLPQS